MDEFNIQKTGVGDKLEREMQQLATLKESLTRSDVMTQNMLSILETFENRLSRLEETIIPIYQETGNLQRRHENIEKTVSALDHVIGFYHVAEEVEPVIRDGPSPDLQNYLKCMEDLQKGVDYFNSANPGSAEMSQVTTLFEAGKDALEREFRNLLTRHSKPVPPVIILDVLSLEEEEAVEEVPVIEHLPEKVLQDLTDIAKWLLNCGYSTDYMQVYYTIRSSILVKSLQHLKDHFKTSSKDSGSLNMSSYSPAVGNKFKTARDTPARKTMKRMAFVKKASQSILKTMQHLEAAGLGKQSSYGSEMKEEGLDIDIDFYINAVSALLKLIQSESALMQGIIPDKHQRKIFDLLIQAGIDLVIKEGEQIANYIRKATTRHDYSAVISIFPVLKDLRQIKPEFDITLERCKTATRNQLQSLIAVLDATGAKSLEEFVDSIRNDPDKSTKMPPDGTVHELTSNTMIFLEQLLEFSDTAGAMLLTQDPTSLGNIPKGDRTKLKLAEFITKVLSALGLSLSNKSETYTDKTLVSIFMLNNYNYILSSLKRSGLLDLVQNWNNETEMFYEDQVLNQKRIYSQRSELLDLVHMVRPEVQQSYSSLISNLQQEYRQSWSRVVHYINVEKEKYTSPTDTKLKDKDRQMIKERFTNFNKEMEEIYRTQKGYAIPDFELRDDLKKDNKEFVLPYYRAFLKKYAHTHFSKNPDKYIRYSERDVVNFIDKFFDSTA